MSFLTFPHKLLKPLAIVACGGLLNVAATEPSLSRKSELGGSWSGVGTIQLPSGNSEQARCRARFSPSGGDSYNVSAVCATSSQRAVQTGVIERIGSNRYAGSFYNPEYNYTGEIVLTVRGNRLSASLSGGQVSGRITLSR